MKSALLIGTWSIKSIITPLMIHMITSTRGNTTKKSVYHYLVILAKVFAACIFKLAGEKKRSTGTPQIITFTIFNDCGYFWEDKKKEWIPPFEEDRLRDRNYSSS